MFVGHYGPAGVGALGRIKLWHGVIAVQFLDILWAPFVLLGVEQVAIVENFTASNHFDLHHMPWTHSLPMALVWSVLAGGFYILIRRQVGVAGGAMIGALVFSHWLFDLLMHVPDLELWFGGPKVGLGLWENRPLSAGLELAIFGIGMLVFLRCTVAKGIAGFLSLATFVFVGAALQIYGNWAPPPPGPDAAAISALIAYALFIGLAFWIDQTRTVRS